MNIPIANGPNKNDIRNGAIAVLISGIIAFFIVLLYVRSFRDYTELQLRWIEVGVSTAIRDAELPLPEK